MRCPSGTIAEQALWEFERASIWPDIVGGLDDDNKAKFHHFSWHFINMPIYLEESDEQELAGKLDHNMSTEFSPPLRQNLNVIQALKGNLLLWTDNDASDAEKAVALCWILHLVGDMHQPLHNVALFSRAYFPKGAKVRKVGIASRLSGKMAQQTCTTSGMAYQTILKTWYQES